MYFADNLQTKTKEDYHHSCIYHINYDNNDDYSNPYIFNNDPLNKFYKIENKYVEFNSDDQDSPDIYSRVSTLCSSIEIFASNLGMVASDINALKSEINVLKTITRNKKLNEVFITDDHNNVLFDEDGTGLVSID